MSYAKFAPITANLLARKGEAAPSLETKRPMTWVSEMPAAREPVRDHSAAFAMDLQIDHPEEFVVPPQPAPSPVVGKWRRIVVNLSPCEFERLGIAAVKKGVSRHELVRQTMNAYVLRLAAELNNRCVCLRDGASCGGSGGIG